MSHALNRRQRNASMKSSMRGGGPRTDTGQRYVVTYKDGMGERRQYGFTDDIVQARSWVGKIAANPVFTKPHITDRQAEKGAE